MSYGFIRIAGEDFPKKKEKLTLADELDFCPGKAASDYVPNEIEYKIVIYFAHRKKNNLQFFQGYVYREALHKYKQLVYMAKKNKTENIKIILWSNDFKAYNYEC